jgi:hypothetical protein
MLFYLSVEKPRRSPYSAPSVVLVIGQDRRNEYDLPAESEKARK